MKLSTLLGLIVHDVSQNASKDIKYYWFEEIYRLIREKTWNWNWNWNRLVTRPPKTDSTNTYTWNAGNYFMTASGSFAATFTYQQTGRVAVIDSRPYKVVKFDFSANRIYFDTMLHTTE